MRTHLGSLSLLLGTSLLAQSGPVEPAWIQLKGAYLRPQSSSCLKETLGFGIGGGQWFSNRWGAEADLVDGPLKSTLGLPSAREQHLAGSALFSIGPELGFAGTPWIPYLRAGLGLTRVGSPYSLSTQATTRFAYHGAVGIQRYFGANGMASLEARGVNIETATRRTEFQALLGVGYRWGAAAPAKPALQPAPAPVIAPEPIPVSPVVVPVPPPAPEPPKPEPPKPEPPKPEPPPAKIILDEALLHFANNQAILPPEAVAAVRAVAGSLKAYSGTYDLVVTGHTSSLGGKAYNKALSLKRAKAVAAVLVQEGLPEARIRTVGMGPDQPLADNQTKEGQAKNRRVEIEVKAAGVDVKRRETGLEETPEPIKKPAPGKKAAIRKP